MTGHHIYPEIPMTEEEKALVQQELAEERTERESWKDLPRAERRRIEREYKKNQYRF